MNTTNFKQILEKYQSTNTANVQVGTESENSVSFDQVLKKYHSRNVTNTLVTTENKEVFKPIIDSFAKTIRQLNAALLTPGINDEDRKVLKAVRERFYKRLDYFLTTDASDVFKKYNSKNEYLKRTLSYMREDDPERNRLETERKFACLVLTLCIC